METAEILGRFEDDLWQSSDHTKKSRLFYAKMWLKFAKVPPEQWDRSLVNKFMKDLEERPYPFAKGSQRQIYQIVKRVFDAARVEWPMGKRAAPKVQPSDVVKPASDIDDVRTMVQAAKSGKLDADQSAYLALSTTYGMRREELVRVSWDDLDFKKNTIYVRTCKGGIERDQLLAPEIIPFLKACKFARQYSLNGLSKMYVIIEYKAGLQHADGAGWHALRRALDTILVQQSYIHAKIFLRWKLGGDMALAYVTLDPLKVDREVFEHHPFLDFWKPSES